MRTSEILNQGADAIREHGWRQGVAGPGSGQTLCLVDAIAFGETGRKRVGAGFTAACDAVRDHLDTGPLLPIYAWNDKPGRTAEEVIGVLRAAALIEEAKENSEILEMVGAA